MIERLLPALAQYGRRIAAQGLVIQAVSERASADVSSVLGPALVIAQAVAKAHQTFFAWVMGDVSFQSLSLPLQARIAGQAQAWHELRGGLGEIAFVRRFPNVSILQRQAAVTLEEVLAARTLAGLSLADFWRISLEGQASLERLLTLDLTLSRTLSIDPEIEQSVVFNGVTPLVPDADQLIQRVAVMRAVRFADTVRSDGRTVMVQEHDTLQTIAKQYLGDPEQWQAIAELNGLRTPYISTVALDQLGAVVGQRVLAEATMIGASVATLLDTSGLYIDQRIRFVAGLSEQTLTLREVSGTEVRFYEPFDVAFPSSSVLTVYNPTYDAGGRVLRPGDLLVLPASVTTGTIVERKQGANPLRLYGADLQVANGQPVFTDGDLGSVQGADNLVQAIRHRFQVGRGQLAFHPLYGTGLKQYLAYKGKPFFAFLAEIEAQQTVLRDPRIASIEQFTAEIQADTLTIDMIVRTREQEQFPVPRFSLDVRTS